MTTSPDEPASPPESAASPSAAAQSREGETGMAGEPASSAEAASPAKTATPAGAAAAHGPATQTEAATQAEAVTPDEAATRDEAAGPAEPQDSPPRNLLVYTFFGLLCIGFGVWLVFAWAGYKDKYAQQTEGWQVGKTRMLEITLIREDKQNLACRSDRELSGVHCAYRANGELWGPGPEVDAHTLQPFNTIRNELFLAAGLWQSPALKDPLPSERFSVVCKYQIIGVVRAVSLRWSLTGSFNPVDQSVAVGTLSECAIPQ